MHLPQHLQQLFAHALGGEVHQLRRRLPRRLPRRVVDAQPEAAGKAQGAQHAQPVLAKALGGVAHGAQDAVAQVRQAAVRIAHLLRKRMPGDRVDGEVAPLQVVIHPVREDDARVPSVRLHVPAKGRYLVQPSILPQHPHRPVRDADGHRAAKEALDVARAGGGGQIPIADGDA